jgi:ribosomal protein S18 acetylase RimI-like enzyme
VAPLTRERFAAGARLLADAFLDDPAWVAIGPRSDSHRWLCMRLFYRAELALGARYHGRTLGGSRDGVLAGVIGTFDSELYPQPARSQVYSVPAFLLAGPAPSVRGLRLNAIFLQAHPHEPHVYVEHLAVDPAAQRSGVGRALLSNVIEEAAARDLPVYLETTKSANVPYYASFGFQLTGEAELPRGARVWFMWRDVGTPG